MAKNNYVVNTRDDCNRVDSNITEFVKKKKKSTNTTNSFSINELDYEHIKNKVKNRSTYHMNNVDWNNNLPRIVEQPTEITVDDNSMHSVSTIISVNNMSNGNIDRVSSMNCNTNNNVNQHKDANPLLRINRSKLIFI